jgi:hypothetical protein
MKARGPGRPKLKKAERRSTVVQATVTKEEYGLVERAADKAGLKVSSWARGILLSALQGSGKDLSASEQGNP